MIPTVEEAKRYRLNIAHFRANYNGFLKNKAEYFVNTLIIDKIVEEMRRENFSEKIWKNTYLKESRVEGDKVIVTIMSEYFSETGFDVAVAREVGTKDHWIRPKGGTNSRNPMLTNVLSWISKGKRLFSKGHEVSGIKSLRIIEKTVRDNQAAVNTEFNAAYIAWMNSIFA
ncbi:MAG: hypothetical protein ACR2NW_09225 [Thermodesulfobacteriota bacterium]